MLKAGRIKPNSYVVYPGHGLAVVKECVVRDVGGGRMTFYKLLFPYNKNVEVLVPESRIEACGIRAVSKGSEIKKVFKILKEEPGGQNDPATCWASATWKKRQKQYREMIDGGKLSDIAVIYRDLIRISERKELSFGERDMLQKAEDLICQEICAAQKFSVSIEKLATRIRNTVRPAISADSDSMSDKNEGSSAQIDQG